MKQSLKLLKQELETAEALYEVLREFSDTDVVEAFRTYTSAKKRVQELKEQIRYVEAGQYEKDKLKLQLELDNIKNKVQDNVHLGINKVKGLFGGLINE